jgi:formylglycine-generating enzyme required for sulfatase activity/tRNA A-37 threonylcarbamoyl transferase component Bud32/DNA-directed RNA polymerase subunit RPC12/RpoP
MIGFICPGCGRKLKVKDDYAGKRGSCPHCKRRLVVPTTPTSSLLDGNTLSPTVDIDGEALGFLAPPEGPGELGRLGPYRIVKVLGAGGMGLVLQAEDPLLKRAIALKVMRPELAKTKDAHQRFLREARAVAAIEHPHIVHVYQVGEDRGVPFLAMPLLKGESLEARLQREVKSSVSEAIRLGRQMAEGLAAAHKMGLIHRDIKPGNIWLEAHDGPRETRDWVKILDFGLARAVAGDDVHLTKTGAILGTPAYMAPEQARAEPVDPRCDLFSLGAVLYRMLTGKLPFKGKDTMSLLMSLATDTPQPVRELNPDVPPSLADLVTQLLAKAVGERPRSARAMADALATIEADSARSLDASASKRQIAADGRPEVPPTLLYGPAGPERPNTEGQRAILEAPTRLIAPSAAPPTAPVLIPQQAKAVDRAKVITNSIGMKFAWIPPGTFQMGSPPGEAKRHDDETQHKVTLTKDFYLGVHEVTQAQWRAVMPNNLNPSYFKGDNLPVETVSWEDCQEFCKKLSQMDGKRYNLPTEAEWEYACRAGAQTAYSFGDDLNQLGDYAWYADNSGLKTHEVGTKKPNSWGLYDMHGNVYEWCQDGYGPYQKEDIRDHQSSNNEDARVVRGGSWYFNMEGCRAAYRGRRAPGDRSNGIGLRVCFRLD